MRRLEDWPERLAAFVEERRAKPFRWGQNDCALFAADAVAAVTGVDLAERWRGRYSDEVTALQMGLQGASAHLATGDVGGALRDMASLCLDGEVAPALARRGDVLLVQHERGESLAVCIGMHAAAPGRRGVVFLPRSAWLACWRVGHG